MATGRPARVQGRPADARPRVRPLVYLTFSTVLGLEEQVLEAAVGGLATWMSMCWSRRPHPVRPDELTVCIPTMAGLPRVGHMAGMDLITIAVPAGQGR